MHTYYMYISYCYQGSDFIDWLLIAYAHAMGRARAHAPPVCGAVGPGGTPEAPGGGARVS